jgi:PilZ domain-containing protein
MSLFQSMTRWVSGITAGRRERACPRVDVDDRIMICDPSGDIVPVLLRNISMGGACIRTDLQLPAGSTLRLDIGDGSTEDFKVTASVISVRLQEFGIAQYGLRITELTLGDAQALRSYMARYRDDEEAESNALGLKTWAARQ